MKNTETFAELDSSAAWAESSGPPPASGLNTFGNTQLVDHSMESSEMEASTERDSYTPSEEENDTDYPPNQESDVAIAIMGLTGSGKSTFISLLADEPVQIGHSLESCTENVNVYSFKLDGSRTVHLIDTPGFDDTNRSDADVLKQIALSLNTIYREKIPLAGMLYLHRITDLRMSGSALKNVHVFEKLCGVQSFPYAVLATTMWGLIEQNEGGFAIGVAREKALAEKDEFWGVMMKNGSRVIRHTGDAQSARDIISYLVNKQASVVLDIQRQMVDENRTLDETSAGQYIQKELFEARKRHEKELAELQESLKEAMNGRDQDLISELSEQRQERLALISQTDSDQANLRITFHQLAQEGNKQYAILSKKLEIERTQREADMRAREKELQELERHMVGLQDELDRTKVEHAREVNRVLREQRGKSDEDRRRFEAMVRQQNLQFEAQRKYMENAIAQERATQRAKGRELRDYRKRPGFVAKFFKEIFGEVHSNEDASEIVHIRRRHSDDGSVQEYAIDR